MENLFKRFWTWRLQNAPEFATAIGVHDYDDRLDEMSAASYLRRTDEAHSILKEIASLESTTTNTCGALESENTLNMALLKEDLEQYVAGMQFKPYLFPLNQMEGPQSDFPTLLSYMKKETENDFEKILNRLRHFKQQIGETIYLLKEGIRHGIVMHNVSVEPLPKQILGVVDVNTEDSVFFKPFKTQPSSISLEKWKVIVSLAKLLIEDVVKPSYQELVDFLLNEYIPKTRSDISASSLPNGTAYYAACLKFHTTTNYTPQEVHDMGLQEVARITERMVKLKDQVQFSGTLKEFRDFLRTDSQFSFSSSEEIVSHYNKIAEEITKKMPQYFARIPKAKFEIVPVSPEIAPSFPAAYYLAPSPDGSRPGTFYINTYKPETRKKYEAVALCLHEAQPGHHTQSALTMESGSPVSFRRYMEDRKYYEPPARFAMNTAYVEGWGLYCEYLGEEMGMYADPYDLFGRLSHEMLRACRLVVDTGMHALGWSRDKAIAFMLENTATDKHDITSEINRYITWPGQACGYKVGEIKIKQLRKKAEVELAEKFDLKLFHDFIASMGGVPLNVLENQIDQFIHNNKE